LAQAGLDGARVGSRASRGSRPEVGRAKIPWATIDCLTKGTRMDKNGKNIRQNEVEESHVWLSFLVYGVRMSPVHPRVGVMKVASQGSRKFPKMFQTSFVTCLNLELKHP
jgi:hypothetical protein